MIFGTLWYMLEEMNTEGRFEIIRVNIDEQKTEETAVIKNIKNDVEENYFWDKDLDLWIREDKNND